MRTKEVFLNSKNISVEAWQKLIISISKYNKLLKCWKIIMCNYDNKIKYYTITKCNLPTTINALNDFAIKDNSNIELDYQRVGKPLAFKLGANFIDIFNYCEVNNLGILKYIELIIFPLTKVKYMNLAYAFIDDNGTIIKHLVLFSIAANILAIDFSGNKRFAYSGVPKYLDISKTLHLLNTDNNSSFFKVDTFPYLQGDFYLSQNQFNFNKHSLILGSSGSGKSKFISLFINNINKIADLKRKYKIVIIDPHASLEDDIGGIGKTIDFSNKNESIDLFAKNTEDITSSIELFLDLFKTLLADQYNSKLERVLRHSIHVLLANNTFDFTNLRKLILDLEFRNELLTTIKGKVPISIIEFFLTDFNDLKIKYYGDAISPIISFIDEMTTIPVFNYENISSNLKKCINTNFLTIFSLNRIKLGDKVTKTISGLIMQQLLTLIQSQKFEEHIIFIVDEVSVVQNPILCRFLSEARKYNLSLYLAGQYFNQITQELRNSIFSNVVNYFVFKVSQVDATMLVDNFNMIVPLDDTKERKIKILTELNKRECVVRIDSKDILLPAFKARTLDFASIPRIKTKEVASELLDVKLENKTSKFKTLGNVNLTSVLKMNSTKGKKGI